MANDDLKKLEMRIAQLESTLAKATAAQPATELTADEIKAYQKVRDAMALDPANASLVARACLLCKTCVLCFCRFCDTECSCGPCGACVMNVPGGGRFGNLGG